MKHNIKDKIDMMERLAKELKKDDETFDRNWPFLYEILTVGQLKGLWKPMKEAGVSFISWNFINGKVAS